MCDHQEQLESFKNSLSKKLQRKIIQISAVEAYSFLQNFSSIESDYIRDVLILARAFKDSAIEKRHAREFYENSKVSANSRIFVSGALRERFVIVSDAQGGEAVRSNSLDSNPKFMSCAEKDTIPGPQTRRVFLYWITRSHKYVNIIHQAAFESICGDSDYVVISSEKYK